MASILVIEDNPATRQFVVTVLGYSGHKLIEAGDGAEGLAAVCRHHPDLVITDILMPTMDGLEFVSRLHADPAFGALPVIFYSATFHEREARALAKACGVTHVLPKVGDPKELLKAVHTALGLAPDSSTPAVEPAPANGNRLVGELDRELAARLADLERTGAFAAVQIGEELSDTAKKSLLASTGRFAYAADRVQAISLRLTALIDVGLQLASERDPQTLLVNFCRSARNICVSKYAATAVTLGDGPPLFASRGLQPDAARDLRTSPTPAFITEMIARKSPCRSRIDPDGQKALGLPASHPPFRSLLAVQIGSPTHPYGWLYLAQKLGEQQFDDADEKIALTLAAQLAAGLENLDLVGTLQDEATKRSRTAERLQESELRFRQLAENIHEVFLLLEPPDGRVLYVSPTYEELWGRSCKSLYADPQSWLEAVHPEDRPVALGAIDSSNSTGQFEVEYRIVRPDGMLRWIRARGFPIHDGHGEVMRVAGIVEDITQRKEHESRIARLNRIYAMLSGINSALVRVHDRAALFREACRVAVTGGVFRRAWIALLADETLENPITAWAGIEPGPEVLDLVARPSAAGSAPAALALRQGKPVICNDLAASTELLTFGAQLLARGSRSMAAFPLLVDERPVAVLALFAAETGVFDEQERRLLDELATNISFGLQYIARQESLDYLAYYDALTGLPNRTLLSDRLRQAIAQAKRAGSAGALLFVNLDGFHRVNDSRGPAIGDRLLRAVATRLTDCLGQHGTVARHGGDEFIILVNDVKHVDATDVVAANLLDAFISAFRVDELNFNVTASVGGCVFPESGEDVDTLFKNADTALKDAKAQGGNCRKFYAREMGQRLLERAETEGALRRALEREEFILFYQPIMELSPRKIVSAEALIRWRTADGKLVPPGTFIPIAEQTGLIVPIGEWVLRAACLQAKKWQDAGYELAVSINVSPRQFRQQEFGERVAQACSSVGLAPTMVELELVESMVMQNAQGAADTLNSWSALGIHLALDDFGTGYSSLAYLTRFPFNRLKIDRSFIDEIGRNSHGEAIVRAVISLGHALSLKIVAEGVETEQQLEFLRAHGCDSVQGYLISRPLPAADFEAFLRSSYSLAAAAP